MNSKPGGVSKMYSVNLEIFEGPLDLLLHLVDKNRLDITEISLAKIAWEYGDYIRRLQALNLGVESSFLVVFASLLEIKSKVLLPSPSYDYFNDFDSNSENYEPPPQEHELVIQLRQYQQFKRAVETLDAMKKREDKAFPRPSCPNPLEELLSPSESLLINNLSVLQLSDIYISLMKNFNKNQQDNSLKVQKEEVSFPLVFRMIHRLIRHQVEMSLFQLFDSPPTRLRFIITFLALLELARQKRIRLNQDPCSGCITIINCKKNQVSIPSYNKEPRHLELV